MGIKNIIKLLKEKSYEFKEKSISEYKNKWIVFDGNLLLYKFILAIRNSKGDDIINSKGKPVSHLHAIFFKVMNLIKNNIKPIFVFDGKPPDIKSHTLDERRKDKEIAKKKYEEIGDDDPELKNKYYKKMFSLKWHQIEECIILLNLMGIPSIRAYGEADSQCVGFVLSKKHDVYGVASEDSDILAFGSPVLLKNFVDKKNKIQEYRLNDMIEKLGLSNHKQYVELSILLGSDYIEESIKKLSAKKALELLIKYENIENVIENIKDKYYVPECYLEKAIKARDYYINPKIYNIDELDISIKKPNDNELYRFMISENDTLKEDQLKKHIKILMNNYYNSKKN